MGVLNHPDFKFKSFIHQQIPIACRLNAGVADGVWIASNAP